MTPPKLPDIPGMVKMTPLEMNVVHFDKRHTLLTPEILASLKPNADKGKTRINK